MQSDGITGSLLLANYSSTLELVRLLFPAVFTGLVIGKTADQAFVVTFTYFHAIVAGGCDSKHVEGNGGRQTSVNQGGLGKYSGGERACSFQRYCYLPPQSCSRFIGRPTKLA